MTDMVKYINTITLRNDTYTGKSILENVDLANVPWRYNSMVYAFQDCTNLKTVANINENVTTLHSAFENCTNLVNTPTIPESVTQLSYAFRNCSNLVNTTVIPNSVNSMWETFANCHSLVNAPDMSNANSVEILYLTFVNCYSLNNAPNLNNCSNLTNMWGTFMSCSSLVNAPTIPNNVIDMTWTFDDCSSLVNAPTIPNSVTNMIGAFANCSNLVNAPNIPNSVTNMSMTFINCYSLVNAPEIPNSVIDMHGTFANCRSLVNAPVIPESIEKLRGPSINGGMYSVFEGCSSLTGDITIRSEKIYSAYNCFYNTSLEKDVYIPFKYQHNGSKNLYKIFINNDEYIVDKNPVTYWGRAYPLYSNGIVNIDSNIRSLYIYSRNDGYVDLDIYYTNNTSLEYNYAVSDHPEYNYIINYNTNDYTSTYNAFIAAGYSATNRVHGALLFDINDEGIDLGDYEYTNVSNDITLTKYIGVGKTSIVTPHLS